MPTQVITIRPDGSIFGLQHKRGQGIDLRQFGHAEIKRATLIEWDQHKQEWFIRWVSEDALLNGLSWDYDTFKNAQVNYEDFQGQAVAELSDNEGDFVVYFQDYEDAVQAEIAVIQAMQVSGDVG